MTDSNRRRRFVPEFGHQNLGATLRRGRADGRELRADRAVPRARPRRPDGRRPERRALPARTERGRAARVPRVRRGRRLRRRPRRPSGPPTATSTRASAGSRSASSARATCPTSTSCRCGTGAGMEREVDVNGVRARLHPAATASGWACEHVGTLRVTITRGRPAAGRPARRRRLPRDPDPGRARERTRCARRCSPAARLPGATCSRVGLTYLFERTTADAPFRRDRQTGSPLLELASNRARRRSAARPPDLRARGALVRRGRLGAPGGRRAATPELDRLAGVRGPLAFDSSGRFHNRAALPGVQRLRSQRRDRVGGHLGAPVCAAPVDLLVGTDGRSSVSRLRLEPAPQARAPHHGAAELARGRDRAAARWRRTARSTLGAARARAAASG